MFYLHRNNSNHHCNINLSNSIVNTIFYATPWLPLVPEVSPWPNIKQLFLISV